MVEKTSKTAYEVIKHLLGDKQQEIVAYMRKHSDQSFTNMELADGLGWSINRVTGRTNELRKKGVIKRVGVRQCKVTGRTAYAMELSWVE